MDKKKIIKYIKNREKIITKKRLKYKYRIPSILIYTGKNTMLHKIKIRKNMIGMAFGELMNTKKTGKSIHNTLKKKKKK